MSDAQRDEILAALGAELHRGFVERRAVAPLSARGLGLSIEDAYRIQMHMLSLRLAIGARPVGKKIGATSEPVQRAVHIDQPDFGWLLDDCAYRCGDAIAFDRLIQPRIEGEIAFVLKDRLAGPGVTPAMVLAATDYVSPCIEIVDSRIRDWEITIVDTIADNASCGVFVLGNERVDPSSVDLAACEMTLHVNGIVRTRGLGAASLGHPATAVAWLANKLGELGDGLNAGDVVLSGSLGALIDLRPDDRVSVRIDALGECNATFVRQKASSKTAER